MAEIKAELKDSAGQFSNEKLLPGPAAVEKITGDRPHYSTFYRWTQRGIRTPSGGRIRLEYVKAASKRLTSVDAVHRFFNAVTAASGQLPCPLLSEVEDNLDEQLKSEGL